MLAGVADLGGVWRRRLAYGGLCAIQGYAAGLVGLVPRPDTTMPLAAAAIAVAAVVRRQHGRAHARLPRPRRGRTCAARSRTG